jgi:sugar lactone lactonase YvrE
MKKILILLVCLMMFTPVLIRGEAKVQIVGSGGKLGSLVHPTGIFLKDYDLFVCDLYQARILVYDVRTGKVRQSYSSFGSGQGNLLAPQAICVDDKNNFYIADTGKIKMFDSLFQFVKEKPVNGKILGMTLKNNKLYMTDFKNNQVLIWEPKTLKQIATFKTGNQPCGIDLNSGKEILVSEVAEHRISFYNETGSILKPPLILDKNCILDGLSIGINDWIFIHDSFYWKVYAYSKGGTSKMRDIDIPGNTMRCWNDANCGFMVTTDEFYVASPTTSQVLLITDAGKIKSTFGDPYQDSQLIYPNSITTTDESIWVTDSYKGTVSEFSSTGSFVSTFGNKIIRGKMDYPTGIDRDENGNLYVLQASSNVFVYDNSGKFLQEIGGNYMLACPSDLDVVGDKIYIADTGNQRIVILDKKGKISSEIKGLKRPTGIYISNEGIIYVSDPGDAAIKVFDPSLRLTTTIKDPSVTSPNGLIALNNEIIVVANKEGHNIGIFAKQKGQWSFMKSYGELGGPKADDARTRTNEFDYKVNPGTFAFPEDVAFDQNFFYVVDRMNQRIQRIAKGLILDFDIEPVQDELIIEPKALEFGKIKAGEKATKKMFLRSSGKTDIVGKLTTSQPWIRLGKVEYQGDSEINVSLETENFTSGEHIGNIFVECNLGFATVKVSVTIEEGPPPEPEQPKLITILLQIDNPKATINGKEQWIDQNNHKITPVILTGRTFVPIRFISEAFGAEVEWDGPTRTIRIYLPGKEIRITLQINNTTGRVNNGIIKLDAPPQIVSGRTIVPLRFIAEAFGAQVNWDGRIRQIKIDLEI